MVIILYTLALAPTPTPLRLMGFAEGNELLKLIGYETKSISFDSLFSDYNIQNTMI